MEAPEIKEPAVHKKTGHEWLDIGTSVIALCISFISIYMAWDNGRDMQKLVHANSWPALQLWTENGGRVIRFKAKNSGIGPARVHSYDILVDGEPIDDGWFIRGIMQRCCKADLDAAIAAGAKQGKDELATMGDSTTGYPVHYIFSPGEEVPVVQWPRTEVNRDLWDKVDLARQQGRIASRACYCSVFDECWVAEPKVFPPRPVKSCPTPKK